jgi:hypothetical protein
MFSFLSLSFLGLGLRCPFFPCPNSTRETITSYAAIAFFFAKIAWVESNDFNLTTRSANKLIALDTVTTTGIDAEASAQAQRNAARHEAH